MPKYALQSATLEDVQGQGYCFARKTINGKEYQGVFFGDDLEELKEKEEVTFTGIVYERTREKEKSFPVEITDVTNTPAGKRADFVVKETP